MSDLDALIFNMRAVAPMLERIAAAYDLHGPADRQLWSAQRLRDEADYLERHRRD